VVNTGDLINKNSEKMENSRKKIQLVLVSSLFASALIIGGCSPSTEPKEADITITEHESKDDKGVFFVNLKDGDVVKSPVFVEMGVNGMEVEPAGNLSEGKGHHHIIIDGSFIEKGTMVPKDETHLHYGGGQTSDSLILSPGKHTLTMQFADGLHQSYGEDLSNTISVTVEE
jgi:hypothetical protein